jgi:hypothetical protein
MAEELVLGRKAGSGAKDTQARVDALNRELDALRAVADAAAYLYRALGYHATIVHPEPAPAPVLPATRLYRALVAAGYAKDGMVQAPPAGGSPEEE